MANNTQDLKITVFWNTGRRTVCTRENVRGRIQTPEEAFRKAGYGRLVVQSLVAFYVEGERDDFEFDPATSKWTMVEAVA